MSFSANEVYMMAGFLLAGYAVVANDAIQTLRSWYRIRIGHGGCYGCLPAAFW